MPPKLLDDLEVTSALCGIRPALIAAYQAGQADALMDAFGGIMVTDDRPRMIDELGAIVGKAMDLMPDTEDGRG